MRVNLFNYTLIVSIEKRITFQHNENEIPLSSAIADCQRGDRNLSY